MDGSDRNANHAALLRAISDFEACMGNSSSKELAVESVRRLATERSFEIIYATSRPLFARTNKQTLEVDWKRMADLRHRLREQYFRDNTDALVEFAKKDLPPLKAFAERIIRESQN